MVFLASPTQVCLLWIYLMKSPVIDIFIVKCYILWLKKKLLHQKPKWAGSALTTPKNSCGSGSWDRKWSWAECVARAGWGGEG